VAIVRAPKRTPAVVDDATLAKLLAPRLNRYIPHKPTPRQIAFLAALHVRREVLFGGATGGGKSDALLMAGLQYIDVPGVNTLIVRTQRTSLERPEGLIPRVLEWTASTIGRSGWSDRLKQLTSPEGGTLTFGFLEGPRDKYQYQSTAFHRILFEEICEFPREDDYSFLFSRQRRNLSGPASQIPIAMGAATNPVGPGFQWVRDRFINYDRAAHPQRLFIPSTLEDNPYIDQEDYRLQLSQLSPILQRKLKDGDWGDMGQGEMFSRDRFWYVDAVSKPPRSSYHTLIRSWDLAASEPTESNPDPDWTSGTLLGFHSGGCVDVLDCVIERVNPGDVQRLVRRTAEQDGTETTVVMPRDPGQAGKDQTYTYARLLAGFRLRVVSTTGSKIVRAGLFASAVNNGLVRVLAGQPWTRTFVDQHHDFPYAKHDDIVDSACSGYSAGIRPTATPGKRTFGPRLV